MILGATAGLGLVGLAGAALVVVVAGGEGGAVPRPAGSSSARLPVVDGRQPSGSDLAKVARTRVFFGHQSVGMNVLSGVRDVFADRGVELPPIVEGGSVPAAGGGSAPTVGGGFVLHAQIGENGRPLDKIKDFDARLRSGLADRVDVALMKLCFVDVVDGTDVDAVFAAYRDTMTALARDYPKVTFVASTVPLTTEPEGLARVKSVVRGRADAAAADNVARERLNTLIRGHFGAAATFDLAAVESTTPDGMRLTGTHQGVDYEALDGRYASDEGHLNADGARRAAAHWLDIVGRSSSR